jgi:hypothetical protein
LCVIDRRPSSSVGRRLRYARGTGTHATCGRWSDAIVWTDAAHLPRHRLLSSGFAGAGTLLLLLYATSYGRRTTDNVPGCLLFSFVFSVRVVNFSKTMYFMQKNRTVPSYHHLMEPYPYCCRHRTIEPNICSNFHFSSNFFNSLS